MRRALLVLGLVAALVGVPVAVLAATGSFTSGRAATPALKAVNSAAATGAKGVDGEATGASKTTYGVYGHAKSSAGYGVYSSGRLGTSGPLVCTACVTAHDLASGTGLPAYRDGAPDAARDDTGSGAAATVGTDGLPVVAYVDKTAKSVKLAHCVDIQCSTATVHTLVTGGASADYATVASVSIVISASGMPVVFAWDSSGGVLRELSCVDVACATKPVVHVVDGGSDGNRGRFNAVALGADGFPVVTYYDSTNGGVYLIDLNPADTAGPLLLSSTGTGVGVWSSVAIGTDGFPIVAYNAGPGALMAFHCGAVDCNSSTFTRTLISGGATNQTSIAIGVDGLPVISFSANSALSVAHCADVACATSTVQTVGGTVLNGALTSIAIGSDGFPVVTGGTGDLVVSHCGSSDCSSSTTETVAANSGSSSSVTVGIDGLPFVAYRSDGSSPRLRVKHCSNTFCTPFTRRR